MEEEYNTGKRAGPSWALARVGKGTCRGNALKRAAIEKKIDEVSGLDLSAQGLPLISFQAERWSTLTSLHLANNSIIEIPPGLSKLPSLMYLDLSGNRIKKVPKEIGRIYSLRELRLGNNLLSSVPIDFGMLYQVEKLDLDGNPLVGQIQSVYNTSGGVGVIRYCRDSVAMNFSFWERKWIFNPQIEDLSNSNINTVTIATYNILCPTYASSHAFSYVPSWALQWDTRKMSILQDLLLYNADILCIQEIDTASYLEFFREQLKIRGGYESVFYQKTRARAKSEVDKRAVDGCAVFWKGGVFQMVEQKLIHLSQLFPPRVALESEHILQRVLPRDNIGVVVVLEREGNRHLVVANAHLHWDPEHPDVKTLQGIMLLREIEGIMSRYPEAELVVCGDFNSLSNSSLYKMFSEGELRPYAQDLLGLPYDPYSTRGYTHKLSLRDSYSFVNMGFTTYTPGFSGVIDYIWCNDKLLPICSLGPVDEEYLSKIVGLPTRHYPSDHLILVTQFRGTPPLGKEKGIANK